MHNGDVLHSLLERSLIAFKKQHGGRCVHRFVPTTNKQTYGNIRKLVFYVLEPDSAVESTVCIYTPSVAFTAGCSEGFGWEL